MTAMKTRQSLQYQSLSGAWHNTEKEAQEVNRQYRKQFPEASKEGPFVVGLMDELGSRKVKSCAGCKHLVNRHFTYENTVYEEAPIGAAFGYSSEISHVDTVHIDRYYCEAENTAGIFEKELKVRGGRNAFLLPSGRCPREPKT